MPWNQQVAQRRRRFSRPWTPFGAAPPGCQEPVSEEALRCYDRAMLQEFRNEPSSDFGKPEVSAAFEAALSCVEARAGEEIPVVVGGVRLHTGKLLSNTNPADRSQVLSRHHLADRATAQKAIDAARAAWPAWAALPARERAT